MKWEDPFRGKLVASYEMSLEPDTFRVLPIPYGVVPQAIEIRAPKNSEPVKITSELRLEGEPLRVWLHLEITPCNPSPEDEGSSSEQEA